MAESGGGGGWRDSYKGMSSDNIKGLVLALSSSLFIGASFIVKKKGLKKAASTGTRAGNKSEFWNRNLASVMWFQGFQFWFLELWILECVESCSTSPSS